MPEIIDDKSQYCIPFVLDRLRIHTEKHNNDKTKTPPFFLGINGVQGAGKTVLVYLHLHIHNTHTHTQNSTHTHILTKNELI